MAEGVPAKTLAVLLDINDTGNPQAGGPKLISQGRAQPNISLRRRSATMSGICGRSRPCVRGGI